MTYSKSGIKLCPACYYDRHEKHCADYYKKGTKQCQCKKCISLSKEADKK